MSDCVTVSDATILYYCSDVECTENTCYAAVNVVGVIHSNQQLGSARSLHDYDVPHVWTPLATRHQCRKNDSPLDIA